ncbi:glycine cleavage system H-protein subunit [Gamsiella multidivaricata]|nr:glycine cleavage system H-protein subunit [Gamsiella multidivaricata]
MRSQAMTRFAAPSTTFARFYATRKFTEEHEWIEVENGVATVGITNHAQEALGEIVYVEPAQLADVAKGDTIGSVESVKAASDIYAPVSGTVIEVNELLQSEPGLLNSNAEDDGWLCKIKVSSEDEINNLLSKEDYINFCEESH